MGNVRRANHADFGGRGWWKGGAGGTGEMIEQGVSRCIGDVAPPRPFSVQYEIGATGGLDILSEQ